MKIKILSVVLVVVMLASLMIGCSTEINNPLGGTPTGQPEAPATEGQNYVFTIWGAEKDQAMLKEMCDAYAAANPQNTYKFLFGVQEENNTAEKVLSDVKNGPDIYSFPSDQINQLIAGGALARIGGEIEANIKAVNDPDSVDAATVTINGEDQLYAYPSTGDNCYFVYYDKRVHSEEDLKSLDTMLTVASAAGKQVHFKLNNDGWYLSSFFFTNPALKYNVTYNETMGETGVTINYDDPAGLTVMQSLRSYIQNDALLTATDDAVLLNGFIEGTASAAVTGTWNATAIKEVLGDNMGVCKLPTANIGGEQVQLSGYKGYKLMGVNGACDTSKRAEAHKLAQWLTNEQNQVKRYETRNFYPTNINAAQNAKVVADPIMQVVKEQFTYNRTQKGVPLSYWTPMAALITPIITDRADGVVTSDEKLQELLNSLCASIRK